MTILDVYRAVLIELNKVQAPSILLDDFCYFYNKAVQHYINEKYNLFETSLQVTDDLRVLLNTVVLIPDSTKDNVNVFGVGYECLLPKDYLHILNCVCEFEDKNPRCKETTFHVGANKLDTSKWSSIITNYYMKPSVKRPYFYILNINGEPNSISSIKINKVSGNRYGNSTYPVMLIKCGSDPNYELKKVYIDYLRAPQFITLEQALLDAVGDTSTILEFPDYVINEIINKIVLIIMENLSNPRIQSKSVVDTSIVYPGTTGASK